MDGERLVVEDLSRRLPEPEVQLQRKVVNVPNRFMIRKEDLEKCGYSANCPGCKAILRGTARQGHSESCRRRIEEELKDDPRMKLQRLKEKEYVERRLEEQEKKRRKTDAENIEDVPDSDMKQDSLQVPPSSSEINEPSVAPPVLTEVGSSSSGPALYVSQPQGGDIDMDVAGQKREVSWEELASRVRDAKKSRVDLVGCSECLQTLESHTGHENAAVFLPDCLTRTLHDEYSKSFPPDTYLTSFLPDISSHATFVDALSGAPCLESCANLEGSAGDPKLKVSEMQAVESNQEHNVAVLPPDGATETLHDECSKIFFRRIHI
jgi:hypothetical protein